MLVLYHIVLLQTSRSIVAQWPLNSIRNYQITDRGGFQIEAGRRSPMGEGVYEFITQTKEGAAMYSLVENYISEVRADN